MKPRGRLGAVGAAVGDLAGVLRRARESRQARIRVYAVGGAMRAVDPAGEQGLRLLEAADSMLDVAAARSVESPEESA